MPHPYKVIVSPEAREQIDEIFEYIYDQSPQTAQQVLDRLTAAAAELASCQPVIE